jgi:hypothetical protein
VYFNHDIDTVAFNWRSFGRGSGLLRGKITLETCGRIRSMRIRHTDLQHRMRELMDFTQLQKIEVLQCDALPLTDELYETPQHQGYDDDFLRIAGTGSNKQQAALSSGPAAEGRLSSWPDVRCVEHGDRCSWYCWFTTEKMVVVRDAVSRALRKPWKAWPEIMGHIQARAEMFQLGFTLAEHQKRLPKTPVRWAPALSPASFE